MNFLEVNFLFALGFELNVAPNTFHTYCSYLQREMMLQPPVIPDSSLTVGSSSELHLCFNEDDSSHQNQQQQLTV
ncbi:hypothetical protein SLEP1_g23827 [Rubroshorea leprosula]|uniref:Cyclin n=1 Tax=Rubroshorea leprosula TaxID=152421 RepID=A0AAV5JDT9_9ROSI|nr:hypothetical protein SLEP1_g23827 [Rubroshorea leprosula]